MRLRGPVEADEEQREGGHALLAIDQVVLPAPLAHDDRAEEVLPVVLHRRGVITRLVVAEELALEVREQLLDVLLLPLVLALVLVDGERLALQQLLHVAVVRGNGAHAGSGTGWPALSRAMCGRTIRGLARCWIRVQRC